MAGNTPAQRLKAVLGRMVDMEHQEIEKDLFAAIYGDKGTTKTTAAQVLAQKIRGEGRILFVDSSDGWVSLDNFPKLKRHTDYLSVPDPAELMVIAKGLLSRSKGFEEHTVIVLDEVSSWYDDALTGYIRETRGIEPDEPLPKAEWNDYGPPQAALINVIKTLHKVQGLHVIIVAHEQMRQIKGDANSQRAIMAMGAKLSERIGQLAHVVARFESRMVRKEYIREAQVLPSTYVDAKTRIGGLPMKMPVKDLLDEISDWIFDSQRVEEDLTGPERQVAEDEPDTDDEDYEIEDED